VFCCFLALKSETLFNDGGMPPAKIEPRKPDSKRTTKHRKKLDYYKFELIITEQTPATHLFCKYLLAVSKIFCSKILQAHTVKVLRTINTCIAEAKKTFGSN